MLCFFYITVVCKLQIFNTINIHFILSIKPRIFIISIHSPYLSVLLLLLLHLLQIIEKANNLSKIYNIVGLKNFSIIITFIAI